MNPQQITQTQLEAIEALEAAESLDQIRAALAAINLTQEDREFLAACGIV